MPGVEIGLTLLATLGSVAVLLVYLSTIAGLSLSFLAGRIIPLTTLARFFAEFNLQRASNLVRRIEPLDQEARLEMLAGNSPAGILAALLKYRYLVLAMALNLPGNFLLGGGGGIALIAGASKLYSVPGFLLVTAVAVAPIPLAVHLFGTGFLLN